MIFDLTEQEANIVLQSLQEMPYKMTANVIAKFVEQARKQKDNSSVDRDIPDEEPGARTVSGNSTSKAQSDRGIDD